MATTVLVVDDHEHFRFVAAMMLQTAGYVVVGEAASGAEAVRLANARPPDAVLLDVQLPDMDGFRVCRELRRTHPRMAVVLCSVRDATDFQDRADQCGARGFLPKAALSGASFAELLSRAP